MEITGAEMVVKALKTEAVDLLFAYPGGQAIHLFDALYDEKAIKVVLPRHEQGLIHAADGYARSTGKVGVCMVTSGPGATNLVTGIATANFDSVPLVCFTGQVTTNLIGNEAFQEVDIVGITRSISKYSVTVRKRSELGIIIKKAFHIAKTGKPGVVVVDIPKDIQQELGSSEYPEEVTIRGYRSKPSVHLGQIDKALALLEKAKRPLFLIGGGVNIADAKEEMTKLAEKTRIPVVSTIMGKGGVSSKHELYIGNIGIHGSYAANTAISNCDVLFSIGTRFNDRITGKIGTFASGAKIIHIDIDSAAISRNIAVDIPIVADAKEAIIQLLARCAPLKLDGWRKQIKLWNEEQPLTIKKNWQLSPEKILQEINLQFADGIITTDVGQNQMWATQFLDCTKTRLLTSGGLGTMGYGFPAAIGAKLGNPEKAVVVITGDGGFQMNLQELATAVLYQLPIIICIFNNESLGNVRQWQELFFNQRFSSTSLENKPKNEYSPDLQYIPDFLQLAKSYGIKGIRVERNEDIHEAFVEAQKNQHLPTLIEFILTKETNVFPIVPPGKALSEMIFEEEVVQ